jgi:hypothetical protein
MADRPDSLARAALLTLVAASTAFAQQEAVSRSIKDLRVLSPDWLCAVVDPTEEILALRQRQFGPELEADRKQHESGKNTWFFSFSKAYRTLAVQKSYHQPLFAKFNQPSFWRVNGAAPADVTVWSHSVDGFPGWDAADAPTCDTRNDSRTADMVYLKLPAPLESGRAVEVRGEDGRCARLAFDEMSTVCWSLKVNQSAYASAAAKKAAYLGQWLPGVGALDCSRFEGKPFHVRPFKRGARWDSGSAAGEPAFSGRIALRAKYQDQQVKREGGANLTGEDVYELDFSAFQGEGLYCVQVPGLGRSWPFEVTKGGYGAAFYTMMKGLYIQRCGAELKQPFTAWARPACHVETRQGSFIPETEPWYSARYRAGAANAGEVGFRDASGQRLGLSQFTLIGNEDPLAPALPGVKGGWHDAADYDRRIYHYGVVWDLLAAFEAFPAHFGDGQLNIPESGNGVPDILDEAAVGVDVWRSTQRADGAVCSWIEQESHPNVTANDLVKAFVGDPLPMYASAPDRAGSYAYAAAAAWLGRLLTPHAPARAKGYLVSAARAYAWAKSDASVMRDRRFAIDKPMRDAKLKGTTIRFDEDPQLRPEDRGFASRGFAAAYLYFATRDRGYLDDWSAGGLGSSYGKLAHGISPSQCVPLLLNPGLPQQELETIKRSLLEDADRLVRSQSANPYRMLWLSPDEGWFHAMAWGAVHGKCRTLAAAYIATRDPKYKASMEGAADFFLGCNPLGSAFVTGLGSVHPVVIQHGHSLADGIAEPVPGIAPYTLTYGIPLRPFILVDKGHNSVKSFFDGVALAFIPDKIGRQEIQAELDRVDKTGEWERAASAKGKTAVWNNFPILRRKVTHPGAAVDQNEFTINETISPLALLFGALTADGWAPADELKDRQPRRRIEELPFYSMP